MANHGFWYSILVVLHPTKQATMQITLTVQSLLTHAFELLIFAPLPILLLTAPFGYAKEWYMNRTHLKTIKKHYSDLELVGAEQLKKIFPHKKDNELEDIAFLVSERNASYRF